MPDGGWDYRWHWEQSMFSSSNVLLQRINFDMKIHINGSSGHVIFEAYQTYSSPCTWEAGDLVAFTVYSSMKEDKSIILPALTANSFTFYDAPYSTSFHFLRAVSDGSFAADTASHYGSTSGVALDEYFEVDMTDLTAISFTVKGGIVRKAESIGAWYIVHVIKDSSGVIKATNEL